jgi:VanZ family protein
MMKVLMQHPAFNWIRRGQFFLAIGIFTYFALAPSQQIQISGGDKNLHFLGNMLLYLSAWVALYGKFRLRLLIGLLIPYSLAIELGQHFSPGRNVDSHDMLANMLGLLSGFFLAFLLQKIADAWLKKRAN